MGRCNKDGKVTMFETDTISLDYSEGVYSLVDVCKFEIILHKPNEVIIGQYLNCVGGIVDGIQMYVEYARKEVLL